MKHILTLLTFFLWSCVCLASDTTIVFRQMSYSDLFERAKKEGKGVMLYFHFDGCGGCLQMGKTAFKDKKVIDFYNTNFINFEINTRKKEGVEINKKYNIRLHPTFIFFDNAGNELHRFVGAFSPEEFYKQANDALFSQKNLTNFEKRYKEGNREPDFLFDYVYMLRNAYELDSTIVNEYLDAIEIKDYALEKNIRFIYEFCIYNSKILIPFNDSRFNFLLNNKNLFYKYFDSDQVKTRIVWILNDAVYKAIEEKDEITFFQAVEILKEYDTKEEYFLKDMNGSVRGMMTSKNLVLSSMLSYYKKMEDKSNYLKTLEIYISKIWDNADELNNFAWKVFEDAKNEESEKINTAIKCSIRSIELQNNYANNDTYAWLLYKSGNKKNALKQANKTIEIAKKNNQDYSETQKLIDTINTKK